MTSWPNSSYAAPMASSMGMRGGRKAVGRRVWGRDGPKMELESEMDMGMEMEKGERRRKGR